LIEIRKTGQPKDSNHRNRRNMSLMIPYFPFLLLVEIKKDRKVKESIGIKRYILSIAAPKETSKVI
jgi:hypothetical protein